MNPKETKRLRGVGRDAGGKIREANKHLVDLDAATTDSGEKCYLLCADTQLMLAEHRIQDMRRAIKKRRVERGDISL